MCVYNVMCVYNDMEAKYMYTSENKFSEECVMTMCLLLHEKETCLYLVRVSLVSVSLYQRV